MNSNEPERRCLDGDSVPTDWTYARSVEEGLRRRQAQNIGDRKPPQEQQELRVRHRAEPAKAADAVRTVMPTVTDDSPFVLPESAHRRNEAAAEPDPKAKPAVPAAQPPAAEAELASAAKPAVGKAERTPAAKPSATAKKPAQPADRSVPQRRRAGKPPVQTAHCAEPTDKKTPEWYQVAMQNLTPDDIRRPPQPPPAAVPGAEFQTSAYGDVSEGTQIPVRKADIYEAAGYPPELLEEQRRLDALNEAELLRKHHGAKSVLRSMEQKQEEGRQPAASGTASFPLPRNTMPGRRPLTDSEQAARQRAVERYTAGDGFSPYTVTTDDTSPEEASARFPWLGLAVSLVLLLAVFLWFNRITVGRELEKVYTAREQAARQVVNEHPYEYRELIEMQAANYNLHPAFVAAIVLNESSFRPGVKSSADAMGLMQIRPDTGTYINRALDIPDYNHQLLYEPETNILFGCYYLGELSERFMGDPVLVAAAYNAGPNNVQNWLNNSRYSSDKRTIPIENIPFGDTQTYARRVMRDFAAYKRLYYETPEGE